MSEFECVNGHLIKPSIGYCTICGGRPVRMDGLTARQWEMKDRLQDQEEPEEETPEEESND